MVCDQVKAYSGKLGSAGSSPVISKIFQRLFNNTCKGHS